MIVTENSYLFDCKLNIADNTTDSLYLCTDIDLSRQKRWKIFVEERGEFN